jgi:hypothetical protein
MKKIKLSRQPKLKLEVIRILVADDLRRVHGGVVDRDPSSDPTGGATRGSDSE